MKKSYKGLLIMAATVMSFISVQSVCAETVAGTISEISSTKPIIVTVADEMSGELIDVYGVRIKYLDRQYNIELNEEDYVSIEAELVECRTGDEVLKAQSIEVGDVTVQLR